MIVSSQNGNASPGLPVPYSDGLVVTGTNNPWVFIVELDSTDVIKVPKKGK